MYAYMYMHIYYMYVYIYMTGCRSARGLIYNRASCISLPLTGAIYIITCEALICCCRLMFMTMMIVPATVPVTVLSLFVSDVVNKLFSFFDEVVMDTDSL